MSIVDLYNQRKAVKNPEYDRRAEDLAAEHINNISRPLTPEMRAMQDYLLENYDYDFLDFYYKSEFIGFIRYVIDQSGMHTYRLQRLPLSHRLFLTDPVRIFDTSNPQEVVSVLNTESNSDAYSFDQEMR